MEAVNILAVIYGFDHALFRDVAGERKLHDETVNIRVAIEAVDCGQKLGLGHVVLEADESGFESALFAGFDFVGYVGLAATVVAHENRCQMRAFLSVGDHFFNRGGYLGLEVGGDFLSVYKHSFFVFR